MANIVRGEAGHRGRVLYFSYSTWQGNDLSVIKNFLNVQLPSLNIPSLPTLTINYIESGQNWFVLRNILLSYPPLKGLKKPFESLPVLCHMCIRFYKLFTPRGAI